MPTIIFLIPGPFSNLLGIEVIESESLHKGENVSISSIKGQQGNCEVWRDMVSPMHAMSLYNYDDDFYNEYACITVNEFGKGKAYYIGGGVDHHILLLKQK